MIEPQVEHGGASSWFWIVECWFATGGGGAPQIPGPASAGLG